MTETWDRAKELFHEALGLTPRARERLLAAADPEVRAEVEGLLLGHAEAPAERAAEQPGTVVDRYKLLQKIGEGGFGTVWMAEQTEPVRRKVALKVVKLGMDTKQVIARFEAERQALALMDHPHIARVLDAGATPHGRPYFVMELVKGVPITDYCDDARLAPAERLQLFVRVCDAVQHAHQKGIVHRDLKPSNVMVTLHDGEPVPKVIDFGIAKATDRRLTDKTLFTEFHQIVGTPEYMAPEQAEMSSLDVDSRADVYSLGVLLYELLTGAKPFELKSLLDEGYAEILRTIREVDPPKPSSRVSTMGERLSAVAARRHTPPRMLGRLLRGDLDWIVMKALEKNRSRRYETADALAADIGRHLTDQPVQASPPGRIYRLRKYLKRHRVGACAAAVVVGALVAGGALAIAGASAAEAETATARLATDAALLARDRARDARAREQQQRERAEAGAAEAEQESRRAHAVIDLVQGMLSPFGVERAPDYTVRQLLDELDGKLGDRLADQPEVEATIRATMAESYLGLGLPDRAEPHVERALECVRRTSGENGTLYAEALIGRARVHHERGAYSEAERDARRALEITRGSDLSSAEMEVKCLCQLADYLRHQLALDEAERAARRAVDLARDALGNDSLRASDALLSLSVVLHTRGDMDGAESAIRDAIAHRRAAGGEAATRLRLRLARVLRDQGQPDAAEKILRDVVEYGRRVLGERHPELADGLMELGISLQMQGELTAAEAALGDAVQAFAAGGPSLRLAESLKNLALVECDLARFDAAEEHARQAVAIARRFDSALESRSLVLSALGMVLNRKGDFDDAEAALQEALSMCRALHGETPQQDTAWLLDNLGSVYMKTGKYSEATALRQEALAMSRQLHGDSHPTVAVYLSNLGSSLYRMGRLADAESALREALDMVRQLHGDRAFQGAGILNSLSLVLLAQGDPRGAETVMREAYEVHRAAYGDEHDGTATMKYNLACLANERGDFGRAERLAREALGVLRRVVGDEHGDVANAVALLANLRFSNRQFAEAAPLYREAIAIRRKIFGAPMPGDLFGYAISLIETHSELDDAEGALRELLERERTDSALATLGLCLLRQGEFAEAEPILRECVAVRTERDPTGWALYNAKSLLGAALVGLERYEQAEPLLIEAWEKMDPPSAAAHRKGEALQCIVQLYEAWEKPAKVAQWRAKLEKDGR